MDINNYLFGNGPKNYVGDEVSSAKKQAVKNAITKKNKKQSSVNQKNNNKTEEPMQTINMEDMNIEADYPVVQQPAQAQDVVAQNQIQPKSSGFSADEATAIAGMIAGASPGLLSLFTGGSPHYVSESLSAGGKDFATMTKPMIPTKDNLVEVVGSDGLPEYVLAKDAVGRQVFQKPSLASGSGGSNNMPLQNIKTGERAGAYFDKATRQYMIDGVAVDPRLWVPTYRPDYYSLRTPQGGTVIKQMPGVTDLKPKTVTSVSGLGDYYGKIPKEEAQHSIKSAGKYQDKVSAIVEDNAQLDAGISALRSNNPSTFALGLGQVYRGFLEGRLSDQEYQQAMGDSFRSIMAKIKILKDTKLTGEIPEEIRQGAINALEIARKKNAGLIEGYRSTYKTHSNKEAQKRADTLPGSVEPQKSGVLKESLGNMTKEQKVEYLRRLKGGK